MVAKPRRIAMWSGPRNISTAMMRAWENRPDTAVHDEPFYAYYLLHTGIDHPGRDEVIAACEGDWRKVVTQLTGPVPDGKQVYYQKHMTQHMVGDIDWSWMLEMTNCFLIREPARVIASFSKVMGDITLEQVGFSKQAALFDYVRQHTGETPPVLDARDVLTNPHGMLAALCERIDVPFTEAMLSWPAGSRPTDGVWAPYWYASVEQSTGFMPYKPAGREVPANLGHLLDEAEPLYKQMAQYRIQA
jgi:hypothetical protein